MIIGISGRIGSGKDTVGKIIQYLTTSNTEAGKAVGMHCTIEDYINSNNINDCNDVFTIKKYATKLKQIASMLTGIPVEKFEDQEFKKTKMDEKWKYWVVEWKHGDDGPGYAIFGSEDEAINHIELSFESSPLYLKENGQFYPYTPTYREFLQKLGTEVGRQIHPDVWVNAFFADYIYTGNKKPEDGEAITVNIFKDYPNWIITDMRFPNELEAVEKRGGLTIRVNRGEITTENLHISETALDNAEFDYVINNNGTIEDLIEEVRGILVTEEIITV